VVIHGSGHNGPLEDWCGGGVGGWGGGIIHPHISGRLDAILEVFRLAQSGGTVGQTQLE
jgi:hypothetical protein